MYIYKPPEAMAKIQAYDGTTWQNLRCANGTIGALKVLLTDINDDKAQVQSPTLDSKTSQNSLCTLAHLYGFNGATWDRIRCESGGYLVVRIGCSSYQKTGTTTDDWVNAVDWTDAQKFTLKTILIKNTGDTNSMDYKIIVQAYDGGIEWEETSGSLAAGDVAKIHLNNHYSRVVVQVKSSTAGSPTDYRIDYCGFKG